MATPSGEKFNSKNSNLPQRQNLVRHQTTHIQGKNSYLMWRKLTYGESKVFEAMHRDPETTPDDRVAAVEDALAQHIVEWNWADENGNKLALPKDDPTVFNAMTDDEIIFLTGMLGVKSDPKAPPNS